MMRRLPSLIGVEAFLNVARTGSLKQAAADMALSTPALSRRISAFEHHIGEALFDRSHHAMELTAAGQKLHGALGPVIDQLRDVLEGTGQEAADLRLKLNVLPLFAQQRLFPRMPELRQRYPRLHIDVATVGHGELRLGDGIDAAIALAREMPPHLHAVRLDVDKIYPIAARKLVEGPDRITSPEQLQRLNVLIHSEMPETFTAWREAIAMPWLEPAGIDRFDSGQLMLEAAAQGVGVAFMHGHHFEDAHDPRLVRLFDFDVDSPYSYWFVCRPSALKRPAVKLFHDWIVKAGI